MKKLLLIVFALLLVFSMVACGGESGGNDDVSKDPTYFHLEVVNESGEPVIHHSERNKEELEELDAIHVDGFGAEDGARLYGLEGKGSDYTDLFPDNFVETSANSYEFTIHIGIGPVPPEEEEYLYLNPVYSNEDGSNMGTIHTVIIKGKYKDDAKVVWDGNSFSQVK